MPSERALEAMQEVAYDSAYTYSVKLHAAADVADRLVVEAEQALRERIAAGVEVLLDAVEFYADPDSYFAVSVLADRPSGGFADDFSEDHGNDFYDRAMPGKYAREALTKWDTARVLGVGEGTT